MSPCPYVTSNAVNVVDDNQNSLIAGPRDPVLMSDCQLMERMAHFNRVCAPEEAVHAKSTGAYGTFTVTHVS